MKGQNEKILRSPHYVKNILGAMKYIFYTTNYRKINFSKAKLIHCGIVVFNGEIQKDARFNNLRNVVLFKCKDTLFCVLFDIRNNKITITETTDFKFFLKNGEYHMILKGINKPFMCASYMNQEIDSRTYKGIPKIDNIQLSWEIGNKLINQHRKLKKRGGNHL